MFKSIVLLLVISWAVSIVINPQAESNNKLVEIKSLGTLSTFIVDLAEVSSELRGPLDDLRTAVSKLTEDLQSKLGDLEGDY